MQVDNSRDIEELKKTLDDLLKEEKELNDFIFNFDAKKSFKRLEEYKTDLSTVESLIETINKVVKR